MNDSIISCRAFTLHPTCHAVNECPDRRHFLETRRVVIESLARAGAI